MNVQIGGARFSMNQHFAHLTIRTKNINFNQNIYVSIDSIMSSQEHCPGHSI